MLGRLAVGGMAEIFLGRLVGPSGFERPLVIKRILPHMAENADIVSMFIDEARIVAGIRHPNVVTVHELGNEQGELFLVLEYLEGESAAGLARRLQVHGHPLEFALGAYIIAEACAGLHAAHELSDTSGVKQNLVHRDVSPQNVFVTYDGGVKVLDFGIATAADRITRTQIGQVKGKYEYMSPEQCVGDPLDRRSDIFAAGIVLYELTTGRRLFKRANSLLTFNAICHEPIARPSAYVSGYPRMLERICMRALAKKREDRYQNALEMRRDLFIAIHEIMGASDPREALAGLMGQLFADRIAQKSNMLRSVQSGASLEHIPAAETDDSIEIPIVSARVDAHVPETGGSDVSSAPPEAPPRLFLPAAGGALGAALLAVLFYLWAVHNATRPAAPPALVATSAAATTSPAPAPQPPSASAEPTPSVAASSVVLDLESSPVGARVVIDGRDVGATPTQVILPRGHARVTVELQRDGYARIVESVTPDMDQRLRLTLVPTPSRPPPPRATSRAPAAPPAAATSTPPPAGDGFRRFD